MSYSPESHHRQSIRLQGYDYSRAGAYFVTICVQNRSCLFGEVVGGTMQLNHAGQMVERWYFELQNKFANIECDEFVCMPNHIHFIVVNVGSDRVGADRAGSDRVGSDRVGSDRVGADCVGADCVGADCVGADLCVRPDFDGIMTMGGHTGPPLHAIVQWFKTMSTNNYIRGVKQHDWLPFPGKLWQRNYWEHIIRDEPELDRIRAYIRNNPAQWEMDKLYVDGQV